MAYGQICKGFPSFGSGGGPQVLDHPRGGQANICRTYADLVGTKMYRLQIFSMGLQIFSMMYFKLKLFLLKRF